MAFRLIEGKNKSLIQRKMSLKLVPERQKG